MKSKILQCAKLGVMVMALVAVIAVDADARRDGGGGHRGGGGGGRGGGGRSGGSVPEIDPGSAGAAIAIAAGGMAVLRDKIRRKR